jgi:Zn-dependent metalloprotease
MQRVVSVIDYFLPQAMWTDELLACGNSTSTYHLHGRRNMDRFARGVVIAALIAVPVHNSFAERPELQKSEQAAKLYSLAARESQFHALSSLPLSSVDYENHGRLQKLDGRTGIYIPRDAQFRKSEVSAWLFQRLKSMLLASGNEELKINGVVTNLAGERFVFLDQWIAGLPVIDGGVNLRSAKSGEILQANSRFVPAWQPVTRPKLTLEKARAQIPLILGNAGIAEADAVRVAANGSLGYWTNKGTAPTPVLVWLINSNVIVNGESIDLRFAIDAATGDVRQAKRISFGLNRHVYSMNYSQAIDIPRWPENLTLLWNEGNPNPSDSAAMFAYEYVSAPIATWTLGGLYDLGYDWPYLVMHHGNPNESRWGGSREEPFLIFGDNYAVNRDAISHEYGHGIFFTAFSQVMPSGALWYHEWFAGNEFIADLSAILTDFDRFGSTDWVVAGLRNLANPASQVAEDLRDWYPNRRFFGVGGMTAYSNSTIFSHAVYLMIQGGTHARAGQSADLFSGTIPTIQVNALPPTTVKFIFADALTNMRFNQTQFNGPNIKAATVASAQQLYGQAVANEVDNAWRAVGIGVNCSGPPAPPANVSYIDFQCKGKHRVMWTQVAGLKYHGEVRPVALGSSWDLGTTTADGAMNNCMQNVPMASFFHMRACNACGCSDWTPEKHLMYYPICK